MRPVVVVSAKAKLKRLQQVVKWMMVFPAVGLKIALVGRNDTAMPQMFGQHDQRGIGEIHR